MREALIFIAFIGLVFWGLIALVSHAREYQAQQCADLGGTSIVNFVGIHVDCVPGTRAAE